MAKDTSMPNRIAGVLALIAFAMCLLLGLFETGDDFVTVVWRAMIALAGTYVVGYLVGLAAERMVSENVAAAEPERTAVENNSTPGEESTRDGR